jgi:hypothetical protein
VSKSADSKQEQQCGGLRSAPTSLSTWHRAGHAYAGLKTAPSRCSHRHCQSCHGRKSPPICSNSTANTTSLVVDYYSRYVEFVQLRHQTADDVINALEAIFARHDVPMVCSSDNGPCYSASAFQSFATSYGFIHKTPSPRFAQSNGMVERAIPTMKALLRKPPDPHVALGLLSYRTSPLRSGYSPAQLPIDNYVPLYPRLRCSYNRTHLMPPFSSTPTASTNNSRQRTTTVATLLAIGEDGRSTIESRSRTYKLKLPSSKYYRSDRISCVRRPATSYDTTAGRCATLCRLHRRPLQPTRRRHQPPIIAVVCVKGNLRRHRRRVRNFNEKVQRQPAARF